LSTAPMYTSRQYNHYMPTADGPDVSLKLALVSDNTIQTSVKHSIVDADEMSWDYLKRVSTFTVAGQWQTDDPIGTVPATGPLANVGFGPPVYYMSQWFNLWRGSLRFTFKLVKTDFHTGRFMIVWTPVQQIAGLVIDEQTSQLSLRHIVDVKEGSEVVVDLPFLFGANYLDSSNNSGTLTISVINELRAPETCSNIVEWLGYWAGGDDLELAVPRNVSDSAPISYVGSVIPVEEELVPQMGELVFEGVGGDPIQSENLHYPTSSIGEKFLSVKQFINKPSRYNIATPVGALPNPGVFSPWGYKIGSIDITEPLLPFLASPSVGGDNMDFISKMYLFYRGSMRVTIASNEGGALYVTNFPTRAYADNFVQATFRSANLQLQPGTTAAFWFNAAQTNSRFLPVGIQDADTNQVSTLLPYYNKTHSSFVLTQQSTVDPAGLAYIKDRTTPDSNVYYEKASATNISFFRSGGDDFQYSYFLGAPGVWISNLF